MLLRYKVQQWLAQYVTQYCVLCQQASHTALCKHCKASVAYFNHSAFNYNLMRWPKIIEAMRPNKLTHLHAFSDYKPPVAYWLKQLKFQQKLLYAEVLADLFVSSIAPRQDSLPEALVPAPLHINRYMSRQYNQARILAQSIGNRLDMPILDGALFREYNTQAQTQLNRRQRISNVSSAFTAPILTPSVSHIAIVDDVITTGATMQAMINAISDSNPNLKIEAWSVAVALSSLNKVG